MRAFVVVLTATLLAAAIGMSAENAPAPSYRGIAGEADRKLEVVAVPLNTPRLTQAAIGTNTIDDELIGFFITMTNHTGAMQFVNENALRYTNCLGEKRTPLTESQVLQITVVNAGLVRTTTKALLGPLAADVAATLADDLNRMRMLKAPYLHSRHLPDGESISGLLFFSFSDAGFYDESQSFNDDVSGQNRIRHVFKRLPVRGSKLHMEFVGIDNSRIQVDVPFDEPSGEVRFDSEPVQPKEIDASTLPDR